MKLLFASDSFKGSLSSAQTAALLDAAAREVFGESVQCAGVAVADGGEGSAAALVEAGNGRWVEAAVHGPLMERVTARYGVLDERRAVLEMAEASGLCRIPPDRRDPLRTTSFGTGELICHALDRGASELIVAIGGSATNDGGMGCTRALGARFLDEAGRELGGCGADLERVRSIDLSGLDARLRQCRITVLCDVTNPLCGPDGATQTFGAQKGATAETVARLERGMVNYRDVIRRQFGCDPDRMPGSGAAGGLGTALAVFLGARLAPGIDTVLDLIDFDRRLEGVDLVVTGEGCTDWQSCFGKVMRGVGERAAAKGIAVVGLSGALGRGAEEICTHGVAALMSAAEAPMPLAEAMARAEELYYRAAVRMFRLVQVGMRIGNR